MATTDDIKDKIATNAASGVQSASGDEGSVTRMSVTQLVEAFRFLAGQTVSANPFKCLKRRTVENKGMTHS
jgi:hypothetical protein